MHFYQHIAHSHNNIIQTSRQSSSSIKFMIQKSTKAFPFFLLATNAIYKNNICSFLCQEIFLSKETFSFYLFPSVDIECIISQVYYQRMHPKSELNFIVGLEGCSCQQKENFYLIIAREEENIKKTLS